MLYFEYFNYSDKLAEIIWKNHTCIIFMLGYSKEEFTTLFQTEYAVAHQMTIYDQLSISPELLNILYKIPPECLLDDIEEVVIQDEYIQAVFRFAAKQFIKYAIKKPLI